MIRPGEAFFGDQIPDQAKKECKRRNLETMTVAALSAVKRGVRFVVPRGWQSLFALSNLLVCAILYELRQYADADRRY